MIPDKAVEAALEAFWANEDEIHGADMRAALEAVLPYLAEAAQHQRRPRTDWPDIPKANR